MGITLGVSRVAFVHNKATPFHVILQVRMLKLNLLKLDMAMLCSWIHMDFAIRGTTRERNAFTGSATRLQGSNAGLRLRPRVSLLWGSLVLTPTRPKIPAAWSWTIPTSLLLLPPIKKNCKPLKIKKIENSNLFWDLLYHENYNKN